MLHEGRSQVEEH